MIRPRLTKKGFTLVELSIAMAFLGILLITIAILVIRIVSIYQSGLAIRAISSGGRELIDDFTRSISGSPIVDVIYDPVIDDPITSLLDKADRLTYKYYFQKTGTVEINKVVESNVPLAGAFCTGMYSYIWNTAYSLNASEFKGFTYTYGETKIDDFRLIRIPDSERSICIEQRIDVTGKIDPSITSFDAPAGQADFVPLELLESAEDSLALYDFRIFPVSTNRITGHTFYSGTFILATLRGGVNIFTNGDYCTEEYDNLNTDFNYCAINKFNFAMRATGETKGDGYGQKGDI